jgi:DNA processing protein
MEASAAWLQLATIPGLGAVAQRRLLKAFGDPQAVFSAGDGARRRLLGAQADGFLAPEAASRFELASDWLGDDGHFLLTLDDQAYPQRLLALADPPCVLFAVGKPALSSPEALAIVGSRAATAGGEKAAERFAAAVSALGYPVVSGLALGIDGAAHRGALSGRGSTVAVLGTGPDRVYPGRHRELAHRIAAEGLLLSEFPPGTPPLAANFPRRNRLIAALSRGVLVVEAAVESGSLITARLAGEFGREVFAVPGSIHSPQSRGCHRLLREGATLVETVDDICSELGWPVGGGAGRESAGTPAGPPGPDDGLAPALLKALGHDPCSIDTLCERSGLPSDAVLSALLELELSGRVSIRPGGYYQRTD